MKGFTMKRVALLIVLALGLTCGATFGAERFENVVLHPAAKSDESLEFDGNRSAPFASDVVVSDEASLGIADVATLLAAVGKTPDFDAARPGDRVGDDLPDALVADLTLEEGKIMTVVIKSRQTRPLIGITWTGASVNASQKRIATAILRNGGRVKFMARVANDEECDAAIAELDGLVMPGGADLDPERYGEKPYPHGSVGIQQDRDVSDVLTTRRAIAINLPGIWICRGEQTINVALGGALIQDIPSYQGGRAMKGEIPADQTKTLPDEGAPTDYGKGPVVPCVPSHYRVVAYATPHGDARHSVDVAENSKFLAPIIGVGVSPSFVSSHHQAADAARLGEGLTVVATAPDGIVEALEYQANDFALATQFHFESDVLSSDPERAETCDKFFRELLRFARVRMESRK